MAAGYRVKTVRFESGERLPMLLCKESGSPLWHPNLFLVTELRAAGLATNTLEHAARAVMIAHQVFRHLGIDIHDRINDGRLLTLGEVESLTTLAGLRQDELDAMSQMDESPRAVVSRVVMHGYVHHGYQSLIRRSGVIETSPDEVVDLLGFSTSMALHASLETVELAGKRVPEEEVATRPQWVAEKQLEIVAMLRSMGLVQVLGEAAPAPRTKLAS